MARINVEQKALSDPRFAALARLQKLTDRDTALGRMVRVWNECIERSTYVLPCWVVEAIFDDSGAPGDVVAVDLAEWAEKADHIRIKGTEGRVEYLGDLRETKVKAGRARAAGASRDPKTGAFTSTTQHVTSTSPAESSAPAPAPAPAPDLKRREYDADPSSTQRFSCRDGAHWEPDPKHIRKWGAAYPALNIQTELERAAVWIEANPAKRKTKRGMSRFVVGWLNRAASPPEPRKGGGNGDVAPRIVGAGDTKQAKCNQLGCVGGQIQWKLGNGEERRLACPSCAPSYVEKLKKIGVIDAKAVPV